MCVHAAYICVLVGKCTLNHLYVCVTVHVRVFISHYVPKTALGLSWLTGGSVTEALCTSPGGVWRECISAVGVQGGEHTSWVTQL